MQLRAAHARALSYSVGSLANGITPDNIQMMISLTLSTMKLVYYVTVSLSEVRNYETSGEQPKSRQITT